MNPVKIALVIATFTAALSLSAQAQIVASDNAGNYSSWGSNLGSTTQASQGTGFGSWTIQNTAGGNGGENGSFLGTSAQLGQSQTINSPNTNSFGLYANSGQTASAIAPFSEGNLEVYQTFMMQIQNNDINGTVGMSLQNSSSQNVFEFYFAAGNPDYFINVWQNSSSGVQSASTVGYNSGPMTLDFTLLPGNAWTFSIYTGNTLAQTLTSATYGDLWSNISQARAFNFNNGGGGVNNFYFNNLEIVPEPATLALFGISGLTLLAFRRRK